MFAIFCKHSEAILIQLIRFSMIIWFIPWGKSAAAQGGQVIHYNAFIAALMAR